MKRYFVDQGESGVNNEFQGESADSDLRIGDFNACGMLWGENAMADTLQIRIFAGQSVPENGLIVHPPHGGELTVWPDGSYFFESDGDAGSINSPDMVTTYYNYVLEDLDGETSVGVFAFHPHDELSDAMQDFQAWSLPDILDIDHGSEFNIFGGMDMPPRCGIAGDLTDHSGGLELSGATSIFEDEVTQILINAQNT